MNDNNDDDEYFKKMETELTATKMGINVPEKIDENRESELKPSTHILSLNTEDLNGPSTPISTQDTTQTIDGIPILDNQSKSETIRAIDDISKVKSTTGDGDGDDDQDEDDEIDTDFTIGRRIWYILRVFVVCYLYIATSFEFGFIFNENNWTKKIIILIIINWLCDIFMWINLYYEYLNYRPDINSYDTAAQKDRDDTNTNQRMLDQMRNNNKSWRKGTEAKRNALKDDITTIRQSLNIDNIDNNNDDFDDEDVSRNDHRWLNRLIAKKFPKKYNHFRSYRLTHKIRFDFIVNFPFDIIALIISQHWKLFIIFRLLKLFHSFRFFEYFVSAFGDIITKNLNYGVWRSAFVSRLAKLLITGIAWIHLWTCIWFFLGSNLFIDDLKWRQGNIRSYIDNENRYDTWLTAYYDKLIMTSGDDDENITNHEYLWSIYFVTVTFSTVGYGDIVPMNPYEIILLIIFQLVNYVFVTIFVAELAPVIEEFFLDQLARGTQHRMLKQCFDSVHIAMNEQDKIRNANRYRWQHQYGMDEDEILSQLPRSLSMEMKYHFLERSFYSLIKHLINKSRENIKGQDTLKKLYDLWLKPENMIPPGLVRKMANECKPKSYIQDEIILSEGVKNNLLYLLIDGKVIREEEKDYNLITSEISNFPNFFGQESFWRKKTRSKCTYKAVTIVTCFVISSKEIRDILTPYPKYKQLFQTIFKKAYPEYGKGTEILIEKDTLRRGGAIMMNLDPNIINKDNQPIRYKLYKYTSLTWDILNAFFIIIQCYTFIWAICFFSTTNFNKDVYIGPLTMNWIIDILFLFDIIFSINPQIKFVYFYPSRSQDQKRNKRPIKNLIIDIFTVFPFEIFLLINKKNAWKTTYIYLLRIFKWSRISWLPHARQSWDDFLKILHIPRRFTQIILMITSIIHIFACIWYFIGTISNEYGLDKDKNLNWIDNDNTIQEDDNSVSLSRSLIRSYYFITITETTIGYGGIVPYSIFEIFYDIFLVTFGSILYWICISFFAMHASYQQNTRIEHTNLVTATEFLLQKQHPNFVQKNRVITSSTKEMTTTDQDGDNDIDDDDNQIVQKSIDQQENDDLMLRLQDYFDFVLQQREGAVSFWDEQKPSLQSQLRYQLLTTAFDIKKKRDPERYRFLEWIPNETMLQFAQHLEWIVVCKGQSIKIKQSGNNSLVLFLITGTLWSPYSKYVYTRHAKDNKDRINKSKIITLNLQCLSPINMKITHDNIYKNDDENDNNDNKKQQNKITAMQTLSTYLQIDVNVKKFEELHNIIVGLYEISNSIQIGFIKENGFIDDEYKIIYQQIPPDQQQQEEQQEDEEERLQSLNENDHNNENEMEKKERKLIFLVYKENSHIAASPNLEKINENMMQQPLLGDNENIDKDQEKKKRQLGEWIFFSVIKKNGKLQANTKKLIANYKISGNEESIDAKHLNKNEWKIIDVELWKTKRNAKTIISIGDELHFEALECCDVVQLYQRDVLESFKTFYEERLKRYLAKATKNKSPLPRRGSVLTPKAVTMSSSKSGDNLAKLIINDSQFAFEKAKIKKQFPRNSKRLSHKLLPQFRDKLHGLSHQTSIKGDGLLRQDNLINKTGTITEPPKFKDVMLSK